MAGGTYSNNTTLKVSTAIAASTTSTGTLYTCSANSYALINLYSSNAVTVTIGGQTIFAAVSPSSTNFPGTGYVVGPSQAVAVTVNGTSATVTITGVEFANSP